MFFLPGVPLGEERKKERNKQRKKETNKERKKKKKEERADRNKSPSTIARTGPFLLFACVETPHSDHSFRAMCTLVTEVSAGIKRAVSRRSSARSFCSLLLSFLDLVSGVDQLLVFQLCCLLEFCNVCLLFKRQVFVPLECRGKSVYSCLWWLCAACRIFFLRATPVWPWPAWWCALPFTQPTWIRNQFHLVHFGFGGGTLLFRYLWFPFAQDTPGALEALVGLGAPQRRQ